MYDSEWPIPRNEIPLEVRQAEQQVVIEKRRRERVQEEWEISRRRSAVVEIGSVASGRRMLAGTFIDELDRSNEL